MTGSALRDLLHERVDDLSMPDLSAPAWRAGQRVRRRRRLGAVAGVMSAVAAVSAVVAVTDASAPKPRPGPAPATTSPAAVGTEPNAMVDGTPVWWSPDSAAEDTLAPPSGNGELPTSIDLTQAAPDVGTAPVARAVAAVSVSNDSGDDRLVLVTPDGYRTLDVSRLGQVTKSNGYRVDPTGETMLSPSGAALLFPQDGHLMVYTLATGAWDRLDTGATPTVGAYWLTDDRIILPFGDQSIARSGGALRHPDLLSLSLPSMRPPAAVGEATAYGSIHSNPARTSTAQAFAYGAVVPVPSGAIGNPETVVVQPATGPATILAIIGSSSDRSKLCCPVVGWTDDRTVVYESRGADPKLIGWRVGTDHFELVARIVGLGTGEWYVASFADLS